MEEFKKKAPSIYQLSLRAFTPEGTLQAAAGLLPHLAELGTKYVELLPVVQADEGEDRKSWSKRQIASETDNPKNNYRIKDYFAIDEEYGTDEDLKDFVTIAHSLQMGVMLDLVYFHCGPNAVFLKDHPDFVKQNSDGSFLTGEWNFPILNFDNPELREYLWSNMLYFVEKFDIDGYRCDVGDRVPLDFWREGVERIKRIKPDFFMLNEGGDPEYLSVFDANYWLHIPSSETPAGVEYVIEGKNSADKFCEYWEKCRRVLSTQGRMSFMIENHDIASDTGAERREKKFGTAVMEAFLALGFTLDGIPFVFNGCEVADDLEHNMFANRFHGRETGINWANLLREKGKRRLKLMQTLYTVSYTHLTLPTTSRV